MQVSRLLRKTLKSLRESLVQGDEE
jgi:hypothetical protein